jgi:hypothetical protein
LGKLAGQNNQGSYGIAIGFNSGENNQGSASIAIGISAGNQNQGLNSIAIGTEAGEIDQSYNSIAIGDRAGKTNHGSNAIAIGRNAGQANQNDNSIILNATGSDLNSDASNALYIAPIREAVGSKLVQYNTTNKEVTYSNVIDISNLSFACNDINDVSGINFCDGTYIGHGNSFDISTNEVLVLNTPQTQLTGGVRFPSSFKTSDYTLLSSDYAVSFNGLASIATLPKVTAVNVGQVYVITNLSESNDLEVQTSSGQQIYSTINGPSPTQRDLSFFHSHIFTAIITSSTSFGWSMV